MGSSSSAAADRRTTTARSCWAVDTETEAWVLRRRSQCTPFDPFEGEGPSAGGAVLGKALFAGGLEMAMLIRHHARPQRSLAWAAAGP